MELNVGETYFVQPDIYTTVIAPGSADIPITVTAYNAISSTLYVNASRGYTRTNTIKPHFAATGLIIFSTQIGIGDLEFWISTVLLTHCESMFSALKIPKINLKIET